MRRRYFVESFEGNSAVLRGDSAHHFGHVLRARPGQLVELSDGAAAWLARVESVSPREIRLALVERADSCEPRLDITLLLSIVKFDRFEWCLEKATELGARVILPLAAARSEKSLIAAATRRAARWQKILFESAQQARRLRVPALQPVTSSEQVFASGKAIADRTGQLAPECLAPWKILLSERREAKKIKDLLPPEVNAAILAIGPEGGWTSLELTAAREAGFEEASLGATILRTETAVIAALAVVQFALGDSG